MGLSCFPVVVALFVVVVHLVEKRRVLEVRPAVNGADPVQGLARFMELDVELLRKARNEVVREIFEVKRGGNELVAQSRLEKGIDIADEEGLAFRDEFRLD